MKNIMNKAIAVFIFALFIVSSCDDMNSIHQEYLDREESVQVGRPELKAVIGGKERVELSWLLNNDPKIHQTRIFWNNRKDSVSVTVPPNRTEPVMSHKVAVPEGVYVFEMINLSQNGHRSLASSMSGKSYGETFRKGLKNRAISIHTYDTEQALEINWVALASESALGTEITYVTTAGVVTEMIAEPGATFNNTTVLKGVVRDSEFSYRTLYRPEKNSFDVFWTDAAKFTVAVNKWTEPFPGPHILSAATPYVLHAFWYDRGFPVSYGITYSTARTAVSTLFRVKLGDTEGTRLGFEGGEPAWGEYAIVGAGGNIGSLAANDWMVYTVEVEDAGEYLVEAQYAATGAAARYRLELNGVTVSNTGLTLPATGAWATYNWASYPTKLTLTKGEHKIRFFVEVAGLNIRALRFTHQP